MPRRVSLPGSDELFRPSVVPGVVPSVVAAPSAPPASTGAAAAASSQTGATSRAASGRVRHDEKMTVYVTADELLDLEHARLELRRHHGVAVDRGRLVRAAVAMALADLDEHGADSAVLRRLRDA